MPDRLPLKARGLRSVLPALMTLDQSIIATAASDPKISEIQNLLERELLPKVERSKNLMLEVLNACRESTYTFTITPDMQGDIGAYPIIVDRSDFQVILASLYAAEAGLHVFFARNLDLALYTAAAAQEAMSQNSSFLDLKSNGVGAAHMTNAKGALLSAEAELETAIDYLLAEIGTDQEDDLIRVNPEDADNLHDIKDSLSYYRTYFNSPKELNVWWWNSNFSLTVDISKFFDAPMDNPKGFLPTYSVTVEELSDAYSDQVRVCYTWQASSLSAWTWPKPTFNGLFPVMNSDRLKEILGENGFNWKRSECFETDFDF